MSSCKSCGEVLEGTEKFCGSCGNPIQHAADVPVASPPPPTEIKPSPKEKPRPSVGKAPENKEHSPTSEQKSNFPVYFIAVVLVVVGIIFLAQQSNNDAPVASTQNAVSSNSAATAPAAPAVKDETSSDAVKEYVKAATQANIDGGIAALAPYRMSVLTCEFCAPVMIYCIEPFSTISDLKGRAIRAHSSSAKALVKQIGGNLQLLVFGEVSQAMQMGLIDCSMSGGIVPQ